MISKLTKLPRLYIDQPLIGNGSITLSKGQSHYLKNVLRRQPDDLFRVFNGIDGEFLAEITALGKKDGQGTLTKQSKPQPSYTNKTHLLFAPIKKQRMDFLIEKSVELGVSDLHPVITARSETKKINTQRLESQIIEAAEQCERLDIPNLHPSQKLEDVISRWDKSIPLNACLERHEAQKIQDTISSGPMAFLVGPEGGFNDNEIAFLKAQKHITPVSLGANILRSETAALACLVCKYI